MKNFLIVFLFVMVNTLYAQYEGPVSPINNGYGSAGSAAVVTYNLPNDHWESNDISVFYPEGTNSPIPTIYYSHAYGGNDTANQIETLRHLASNGYAIVFVPYKTFGVDIPERYLTLYDGFVKASRNLTSIIDTTRIGFFGHSFGGGATPSIAYKSFVDNNWGSNGKFMYISAPWYSHELGLSSLSNFPGDCNLLTVLYANDSINDHRMGMDIFNNIAIDESRKDCIVVNSDTISSYVYQANHRLPSQYTSSSKFDALDYYVTFRLLDALADYTFTGNVQAGNIALGNGSESQIDMGGQLSPLQVYDDPTPTISDSIYEFPCNSIINERQQFCPEMMTLRVEDIVLNDILIYPNPSKGLINIDYPNSVKSIEIVIYNQLGEKILVRKDESLIDLTEKGKGLYYIAVRMDKNLPSWKAIILR